MVLSSEGREEENEIRMLKSGHKERSRGIELKRAT